MQDKWNHTVCDLLNQANLTWYELLRFIHTAVYISNSFLLLLTSIPLGCFLIYSLADKHLDCFQFGAIMNE